MSKINQISWENPEKRKRTYTLVPRITVSAKPEKSGENGKVAPYFRFTVNKPFLTKYYPTNPKVKRISIYVGGQGVLVDVKPGKDQPFFEFGKGGYFSDRNLIEKIAKHFSIPIKPKDITTFHLHVKPFGIYDEKSIYALTYINGENPDTTQLEGLKEKLEADENFPEPDKVKPTKIKVEG